MLKRDSNTGGSSEYCEIFKNTYFEEHLPTADFGDKNLFNAVFSIHENKYGPEITPYLDTFHAVIVLIYQIYRLFPVKRARSKLIIYRATS